MRIPGEKALRRSWWSLRGRIFGGGVVLGYHRVDVERNDLWNLCVDPDTFDRHMEILARDFQPVALSALDGAKGGRSRRLPAAVTFDDGYADILTQALPILERHGVPATSFVVPSALSGTFWWDRLGVILSSGREQPAELDLRVDGAHLLWSSSQGRPALRRILHGGLLRMKGEQREEALILLARWAGLDEAIVHGAPVLSFDQLRTLAAHPLVEIGSHTMSHSDLRALPSAELEHEIQGSQQQLRELIGHDVESFSYPHGLLGTDAREQVARAGYRRACTSASGLVQASTDRYRLPRLWAPLGADVDFRRWLHGWTGH